MSTYPLPEDVTAPRMKWKLIRVLFKGDPEDPTNHIPDNYSVAIGMWENETCLAMRWNAGEGRPVGNPSSRGLPVWFIIPKELQAPILSTLDKESQAFARNLITFKTK